MENKTISKRKYDGDNEADETNKKPHNEEEFLMTQISADSIHIDDSLDVTKTADKIISSQLSETSKEDLDIDETVVDMIVQASLEANDNVATLKAIISSLQSDLLLKDAKIQILLS